MELELKIDSLCKEPKIIIITDKVTDEVNEMIKILSNLSDRSGTENKAMPFIVGFRGDTLEILDEINILRVYASSGKVFAVTNHGEYVLRLRLYELEERLDPRYFVRISNSEIINLKKVKGFDLSFRGTICVSLTDGAVTYVSRRYVSKIKQVLGI